MSTKVDDIDGDLVLLELLADSLQLFGAFFEGTGHKGDNALSLVLVRSVL
jgi:hypothetical protein